MTDFQPAQLQNLVRFWDEFASGSSIEMFKMRFLGELEILNQFQKDFPQTSPEPLLRTLELKVALAFRQEFPAAQIASALPRLRIFEEGSHLPV